MKLLDPYTDNRQSDDGGEKVMPDWDNPPSIEEVEDFLANAPESKVRPWALLLWDRYVAGTLTANPNHRS